MPRFRISIFPLVSAYDMQLDMHPMSHSTRTVNGTRLPPLNTTYIFNQLKDHNNVHSLSAIG
ncbi:hypothetical protein SCLCIDRAFT_1215942, partial [Scleroderma citrinum Foug A]